jgi:hypothetical protein
MSGLRWYEKQGISTAAGYLKQRLESDTTGWLDYAVEAGSYLFRDSDGIYRFLDVSTDRWYLSENGNWRQSTATPDNLEGLDALFRFINLPKPVTEDLPGAIDGQRQPVEVLEFFQLAAKLRYRSGMSSSKEIEEMLSRLLLLDNEGFFWTIGFRSGDWYRFLDGKWKQSPVRPNLGRLMSAASWQNDLPEDAAVHVYQFLLSGASTLPEAVTTPWNPPEGFPGLKEPGETCSRCRAHNLPSSRFCSQCGARLGCPKCGEYNPPGSRFCSHCGHNLAVEKAEP